MNYVTVLRKGLGQMSVSGWGEEQALEPGGVSPTLPTATEISVTPPSLHRKLMNISAAVKFGPM